jgi:glycosyltransferase involved in cell wall biosynthesis
MRALHVLPMFGPGLTNGSEHYAYMLTRQLVEQGITVDVFTTRSAKTRPAAPVTLRWRNDYPQTVEQADGISIHRFPVSVALPPGIGHLVSALVQVRWMWEERRYGVMVKGSAKLEMYYHRRALARPAWFDQLLLLGLGPWSWPLHQRLIRDLHLYDIVLTGFVPFVLPRQVITLARQHHKPVVFLPLFHPDDLYHHHQVFYECLSEASAILAQTLYSTDLFKKLVPSARPVLVGAGVDVKAFSGMSICGARFREKYALGGHRLVLCVGRKEANKRYDLAIAAVEALADPQVKLVMIGEDIDQKPIHSQSVRYLGKLPREDLIDAYEACDVLILPSDHESFGIVVLEAWMRRKPVVGNARCRPIASLIHTGEDGFVCWTVAEMTGCIRQLLDDPDLARRLGEHGCQKTREQYTWDVIGSKVAALYRQLVAASVE